MSTRLNKLIFFDSEYNTVSGIGCTGIKDTHADHIAKSKGNFKFVHEELYPEHLRDVGELKTLMTTSREKVLFFDAEYKANLRLEGAQAFPKSAISKLP